MSARPVFITGLAAEAIPLVRSGFAAFAGGGTPQGAARQARAAIEHGATALISFGLAGGLDPALPAGAAIRPRTVLWRDKMFQADAGLLAALGGANCDLLLAGDGIVAEASEKSQLFQRFGAAAIDLESGAVAEIADEYNVPFAVLRAVCDTATRSLPPAALMALDSDGAIGFLRVTGSVIAHPAQIASLLALAQDAYKARKTLVAEIGRVAARGTLTAWP
jgi:adenosylhomocysteine nucleosidase